tara:strand:+ start:202 stop:585 length:384 start_codon:yes stop_codon:yes gene_type:complete
MYSIKTLPRDAIKHLMADAKKEGILFPKLDTKFICILNDDSEVVGFSGMRLLKSKAIMKNVYIDYHHRKQGLASELILTRLTLLKGFGYKIIEANCTKMSLSIHLKHGAKIKETYKNGITKVIYENL